jgi:hypothetical protein
MEGKYSLAFENVFELLYSNNKVVYVYNNKLKFYVKKLITIMIYNMCRRNIYRVTKNKINITHIVLTYFILIGEI